MVQTCITYDPGMKALRERREDTRSFLLGSVLGASAAFAAVRRRRRRKRRREVPMGLAAFESAPCYRELTERDRSADT
jgi:hypothetical protein